MKKRLLSLLLAVVLVTSLLPGISLTAMATGDVVTVNGTAYTDFDVAIAAAQDLTGDVEIKLLANINAGCTIDAGTWTFDLNGYEWEYVSVLLQICEGAQVLITDTSDAQTGKMVGCLDNDTIWLFGNSTLKIAGGTIMNEYQYMNAISVYDDAKLIVSGGTMTGGSDGGASIAVYDNANVTIKVGQFTQPIRHGGGTLIFENDPENIQVTSAVEGANVGTDVILPAGYAFFDKDDNVVATLGYYETYTIGNAPVASGITVTYGEHGSASAPATAYTGETVTITATPEEGYVVETVTVTDADNNDIAVNGKTFVMPETAVAVHVTFEEGSIVQLKLGDSYGDGWNGNAIEAKLWDGETETSLGEFTFENGLEAAFDLDIPKGYSLRLYWVEGSFAEECSFTVEYDGQKMYQAKAGSLRDVVHGTLLYEIEPGVTLPAGGPYGLELCGEPVMPEKLSGDGWSYDPETNTLTLNNYHGTTDEEIVNVIYAEGDLTIVLKGKNTISTTGADIEGYGPSGICVEDSLTIKGTGSLEITAMGDGMNVGDITIESGDFTINSEDGGIDSAEDLTIQGGTFTITSGDEGFDIDGDAVIHDGKFTITTESDGIDVAGSLTINGGEIVIDADSAGLECGTQSNPADLTINGGTIEITTDGEGDPALLVFGEIVLDEKLTLPSGSKFGTWTITQDGTSNTFTTALDSKGEPHYTLTIEAAESSVGLLDMLIINGILGIKKADFDDVHKDDYFYKAVNWAVAAGITNGMDDKTFGADLTCTRAQAVTFLWRAAGSPTPKSSNMPFTDVAKGSYYYDAVLWAVEQGITNGLTATTFGVNADCTRAQIVTFLWRAQGSPATAGKTGFADVADNAYYADAVRWAVAKGITNGMTATTFGVGCNCTRAQIVTFLYRCMK